MSGRTRARWGEVALVVVAALALVHHLDHVLRADYSGWPLPPR